MIHITDHDYVPTGRGLFAGEDNNGSLALKRAEGTIIDGGGNTANGPGVDMAEGE